MERTRFYLLTAHIHISFQAVASFVGKQKQGPVFDKLTEAINDQGLQDVEAAAHITELQRDGDNCH